MADLREPPPLDDYSENEEVSDMLEKPYAKEEDKDEEKSIVSEPVEKVEEPKPQKEEVATQEIENDVSFDEGVAGSSAIDVVVPVKDVPADTPIPAPTTAIPLDSPQDDDAEELFDAASSSKPIAPISLDDPVDTITKPAYLRQDEPEPEEEEEKHDIAIEVSDPHKKGEGMNAFMSYKVHTKTSMPTFKRPDLTVDRRFSDFLGLHEKMLAKHRHAGRVVPPAPEKSLVGMTLIKMSKSDEEAVSIDFVEKRRAALERYLNRIARHSVLVQDQDFRDFLEQDDLPQATNTRALSGAGVMRLVKNVEGAINKITFKMTEEDSWFEEKHQQIESLEQQLIKLHSTFDTLVHRRKELAVNTALFAKSAATLGNAEEHTALSRALAQLSDAFEKIESVNHDQANTDYYGVTEALGDYLRIISEIKEVFMVRVKSWHNWQSAVQAVNKKKEAEAKMRAAGKGDKVSQIQSDLRELEARVETSKSDFDELSATIKKDIQKFEKDRIFDFRQLVLIFLKNLMKSQEQCMKNWEAFMPEARAIA
ncbi:sorting nexin-2-like [Clavelina lepadiformis]